MANVLRRQVEAYSHWCPACKMLHQLPDRLTFDGNLDSPTFTQSLWHSGVRKLNVNGYWSGKWARTPSVCHYVLTAGMLNFCDDCTHDMAGKSVPIPTLPWWLAFKKPTDKANDSQPNDKPKDGQPDIVRSA